MEPTDDERHANLELPLVHVETDRDLASHGQSRPWVAAPAAEEQIVKGIEILYKNGRYERHLTLSQLSLCSWNGVVGCEPHCYAIRRLLKN